MDQPVPRTAQTPRTSSGSPEIPSAGDPHVAKANAYIEGVLSGAIPACKFVKLACARQKRDLDRFRDHPIYFFDEAAAGRACRFIECLPHIKGPKANAGEKIKLEPWQCFIVTTVYGWLRKDTGGRRFGKAYSEVPRGNGKSPISSGVALYGLTSEAEQGAEVYSAATTRGQARIVFGDAQAMLRKAREFAKKLGVVINKLDILQPGTNSKFEPLSRDAGVQDGLNVSVAVVDELHAHKTRETFDVIETGCAKRPSSLLWVITTAGKNTAGICYEVRTYCVKVLEGTIEDDSQFAIIYTIDEGDDRFALSTWIKANPNWGVSVQPEKFAATATKAQHMPSARNNFFTKHLNVWCNADVSWMDMRAWDRCGDQTLADVSFAGETCTVGLDLASTTDIAAKAKVFWKDEVEPAAAAEGAPQEQKAKRHYYLFVESYLPEAAVEESRNSQYAGWVEEDRIKTTDGDTLDFEAVKRDVLMDRDENRILQLAFDPWQAQMLANELASEGITTVEVRPTVQNFSAPMKEIDALVRQGRLHHDGNPVMRWMVSNVVVKEDVAGNIYPRKERPENKIDGVIAALMALSRAMLEKGGTGSYLESGPLITV